jgi:hypothetical protein
MAPPAVERQPHRTSVALAAQICFLSLDPTHILPLMFLSLLLPILHGAVTLCLVGERRERSGADPCFGDGSDPSQVWLEMLGWSGSDLFFVWLED